MWGTFTSFNECSSLFLTALYECVCHFFSHALNLSFSLTHYLRLFLSFYLVTHTLTVSLTNYLTLFFHLLSFIDSLSHPFTHSEQSAVLWLSCRRSCQLVSRQCWSSLTMTETSLRGVWMKAASTWVRSDRWIVHTLVHITHVWLN